MERRIAALRTMEMSKNAVLTVRLTLTVLKSEGRL
jgi:hypothetical protein